MEVDDEHTSQHVAFQPDEQDAEVLDNPRFFLFEFLQLEKLLQRCLECGKLSGGQSFGKPRCIIWRKSGTNMTANMRCSCRAQVASVSYPDLSAMLKACGIAGISKSTFQRISRYYLKHTPAEDKLLIDELERLQIFDDLDEEDIAEMEDEIVETVDDDIE
uniref:Uncharacterized protein n=1 Tax=Ditylenchus dipsaci TaxID=166011 RepID=A0A915CTC7_9BILA